MKRFCLIEYPKKANLSTIVYNDYFERKNIDAVYDSLSCNPIQFDKKINNILRNYIGINITNPFKEKVLNYLHCNAIALKIGSVNCIADKVGYNTDWLGFYKSLSLAHLREPILIIGAGGVARSIIYSFSHFGIKNIYVTNRTLHKALNLLKYFPFLKIIDFDTLKFQIKRFKTLINATTIGIKGESFDFEDISFLNYLCDVIYYKTPLQKMEKEQGVYFTSGKEMWYYQAIENLKLWGLYDEKIFEISFNYVMANLNRRNK